MKNDLFKILEIFEYDKNKGMDIVGKESVFNLFRKIDTITFPSIMFEEKLYSTRYKKIIGEDIDYKVEFKETSVSETIIISPLLPEHWDKYHTIYFCCDDHDRRCYFKAEDGIGWSYFLYTYDLSLVRRYEKAKSDLKEKELEFKNKIEELKEQIKEKEKEKEEIINNIKEQYIDIEEIKCKLENHFYKGLFGNNKCITSYKQLKITAIKMLDEIINK